MKKIMKLAFILLMSLTILAPTSLPIAGNLKTAEAATTIKINKRTLTLEKGKTYNLKITGTTKKVTWSSSKKAVATVSSKGKVTAKTVGTSTITATIGTTKLTCKVTVKEPANPYLKDAPFNAVEFPINNISLVLPEDWKIDQVPSDEKYTATLYVPDATYNSSIIIEITLTNEEATDYSEYKEDFKNITEEYLKQVLQASIGATPFEMSDFTQSDFKANMGYMYRTEYNLAILGLTVKQIIYDFYLDNYFIEVTVTDADKLDLDSTAQYILNSIIIR